VRTREMATITPVRLNANPSASGTRTTKARSTIVILGGLLTSMALNLLILPTLALRYAKFESSASADEFAAAATDNAHPHSPDSPL